MLLLQALRGQTEHGSSLGQWPRSAAIAFRNRVSLLFKRAKRILLFAVQTMAKDFSHDTRDQAAATVTRSSRKMSLVNRRTLPLFDFNAVLFLFGLLGAGTIATAESNTIRSEDGLEAPTVLVLGDSISAAYGMALEQGWVELTERRLQQEWPELEIVNASISGDTSAGGLRRLPTLLETHTPDVVVIELGGNDGLRGYPVPELESNLTAMAKLVREAGSRAMILPMEIPPNYGPRYTSAFRDSFINASKASGAVLGRFLLDGVATESELMQDDGIHPTIAAQPLIADMLEADIRRLLQTALGS